jgi:hypothetical protein
MRWIHGLASAVLAALAMPSLAATPTVLHIGVGTDIAVDVELSGTDAVGFAHRQRNPKEEESVAGAMRTLSSPDEWIRFNGEAHCRMSASSITANIYRTIDPEAPPPKPPITKPAFDVHYTFTCDTMPALHSLDLMLISRFPRVTEVIVDVRTPTSHHAEIVTTPTGAVSLTPK